MAIFGRRYQPPEDPGEHIRYMEEQLEFFARQTEKRLGELEKDLAGRLGRKVKIAHKGRKGKIELEYYSEQDLETLLALLQSLKTQGGGQDG